jgi:3-phenylpropionate/trans-cinnamate dioxygenase ferredoxin reductase subunit
MAGHEERSDLFDLGFQAVGDMDARLEMFEDWVEPLAQGVVYYLDSERHVTGVLLWNVWDRLEAARELVREGRAWKSPGDLAGRIRP